MNSMRLRPPRPPRERASRESQTTEMLCTAEKVSVFGRKVLVCEPCGTTRLSLPLEGKVPEGRMRCRLRVAEPFTNEKVTLCSVTRCRATPHSSAPPPPSPQRGRLTVGFCFADRDFQTASPEVYAILCSCKERLCQESTLRGLRREVSPVLLRRTEMKSKAGAQCGSAPRDPPENGQAGRAKQQRCCAQRRKFLCSGEKC